VHMISVSVAAVGVYLVLGRGHTVFAVIMGGGFLMLGWVFKTQLGKYPRDAVLTRAEAPQLYALVDSIALTLRTPRVDGILITRAFNAGLGRVGMRQRRLLALGKPLWDVLQGQERVALLAHELAHEVNGDFSRTMVVASACDSLA